MSRRLSNILARAAMTRVRDLAFAAFVALVVFMSASAIHLAGLASR